MSDSGGLTSIYFFKTAEDGRRLFFPWGSLGSGYVIPSEEQFGRLRRHVETYLKILVLAIIVLYVWQWYLGGGVPLLGIMFPLFLLILYALWAHSQCRRLHRIGRELTHRTKKKLTWKKLTWPESIAGQGSALDAVGAWLFELAALVSMGAGVSLFRATRITWLVALALITFSGLSAIVGTRMLIAKMREPRYYPTGDAEAQMFARNRHVIFLAWILATAAGPALGGSHMSALTFPLVGLFQALVLARWLRGRAARWAGLSFVGGLVGGFVGLWILIAVGSSNAQLRDIAWFIGGAIFGVGLGLAQWTVIRVMDPAATWAVASGLSWGFGILCSRAAFMKTDPTWIVGLVAGLGTGLWLLKLERKAGGAAKEAA